MGFLWEKKGLIYTPDLGTDWQVSHANLPTPVQINEDTLRIFYSTRDKSQKSRTSYIDVNLHNINEVINVCSRPVVDIGNLGAFDDVGSIAQFVLKKGDEYYIYYAGYNIGTTAKYRIGIGLAKSVDADHAVKFSAGPIMDRSIYDPCGCTTPFIIFDEGIYKMWYTSFYKWEMINGVAEPFYRIVSATSEDAINWKCSGKICIDVRENEGGVVRPTVIKIGSKYYMWYSFRRNIGGNESVSNYAYRIGFATSDDGNNWVRKDNEFNLDVSAGSWDSETMAYPYVLRIGDVLYMFYVGNGFGKTGFGYATAKINE